MLAGKLDRYIAIEEATEVQLVTGEVEKTWSTFAQRWASFNQPATRRGNKERFEANQTVAISNDYWEIRYLPGLKANMRIVYQGQLYNITSIREIGRKEGWQIETENKDRLTEGD